MIRVVDAIRRLIFGSIECEDGKLSERVGKKIRFLRKGIIFIARLKVECLLCSAVSLLSATGLRGFRAERYHGQSWIGLLHPQ
jgi:hypothetical protein